MSHIADNLDLSIFRHHLPVQIRFNDLDMLGHVNNAVYFSMMDLAKTRYFEEALDAPLNWKKIGMAVVNVNCDFVSQTFFDDKIEVLTSVTHIGEKSMRLEQVVVGVDDSRVRCVCHTVMAAFDMQTLKSAPILPEWRAAFEKYEGKTLS